MWDAAKRLAHRDSFPCEHRSGNAVIGGRGRSKVFVAKRDKSCDESPSDWRRRNSSKRAPKRRRRKSNRGQNWNPSGYNHRRVWKTRGFPRKTKRRFWKSKRARNSPRKAHRRRARGRSRNIRRYCACRNWKRCANWRAMPTRKFILASINTSSWPANRAVNEGRRAPDSARRRILFGALLRKE